MGTGASGEIRETLPQMNSSSMRSPMTRILLPAKASMTAHKRAARESAGIGRGDLGQRFPSARRLGHGAIFPTRHGDQGKSTPGNQTVHAPPQPHRLVENLEHGLVDTAGTEQLPISPPGR